MDKLLKKIYMGDQPREPGFMGVTKLYHIAKKYNKNVTVDKVRQFLDNEKSYLERKEFHDMTRGKSMRYFNVSGPNHLLIVDTMYLKGYPGGFKFALVFVDAFTRMVWVKMLKQLNSANATRQIENLFKEIGHTYPIILSDNGSEFLSSFDKRLRELNIKHRFTSTFSVNKTSIAERMIRTIRNKVARIISSGKTKNKAQAMKLAVQYINSTVTRAHDMTPEQALEHPGKALENILSKRLKRSDKLGLPMPPKFKVGAKVYIKKEPGQRGTFWKSGDLTIFPQEYSVQSIIGTEPYPSYRLARTDYPWGSIANSLPESRLVSIATFQLGKDDD